MRISFEFVLITLFVAMVVDINLNLVGDLVDKPNELVLGLFPCIQHETFTRVIPILERSELTQIRGGPAP